MSVRRALQSVVREDTALFVPVGTTFDGWLREAQEVQRHHRGIMWHLGDIFLWGEERFGERYAQAVEDYSEDSIQRAMRVCRAFPPQRRRKCGFSFHQAIVTWTERDQDEILDQCERAGWTREVFREEVRRRNDAKKPEPAPMRQGTLMIEHQPELAPYAPEAGNVVQFPAGPVDLAEPAPLTPEVAADTLRQALADGRLPDDLHQAVAVILEERDRLLAATCPACHFPLNAAQ